MSITSAVVAFTQTDPMPYGAGTAFESAYVYAGARPTVMTDPSGLRFSSSLTLSRTKGPKAPDPTCEACDLTADSAPPFLPWLVGHGVASPGPAERASYVKLSGGVGYGLVSGKPLAALMLNHYLGNSGATVNWVLGSRSANNRAWNHLVEGLEQMYDMNHVKDGNSFRGSVNEGIRQRSGKFQTPWTQFDAYGLGSDNDLRNGLGSFFFKVVSNRSPSGKWCSMFYVADRYQFDPGLTPAPGSVFTDRELSDLHRTGFAKNFDFLARVNYG